MLKTQILNYQYEILSNKQIKKPEMPSTYDPDTFQEWNLNKIINQLLTNAPATQIQVRWIGNHPCSSVLAFFYCVFKVCASYEIMVVKLKYSMYQISQYYLSLSEQKALIQFLSLLYDNIDLPTFFIQNRCIQRILIKIYQALGGHKYTRNPQSLCQFCTNLFDFMQMNHISEISDNVFSVSLSNSHSLKSQISNKTCEASVPANSYKTMYIVREKSCYFVCEHIPAYIPSTLLFSSSKNHQSSVIKEQQDNEQEGKIPSFLVNKKQIKSQTRILQKLFDRHEPSINVPFTTSINQSKVTINEKIKDILNNSPMNKNGIRNTLFHRSHKDPNTKNRPGARKSPSDANKETGYSKSPQRVVSTKNGYSKEHLSGGLSPSSKQLRNRVNLNHLDMKKINKVHSQRNLYTQNSARSDEKSKKNLRYKQKQTSRNTSLEKEYMTVLLANSTATLPRKQSLATLNEQTRSKERLKAENKKNIQKEKNYPSFTSPQFFIKGIQSHANGKAKGLSARLKQQLRNA